MTLSASIGCYNNELFRNDYKKQRVYRGIVYENGEGNYTPIGRTVSMKQIVNKPVIIRQQATQRQDYQKEEFITSL